MIDYYVKPREKRVQCNVRIPGSLKDDLVAIVRLWQLRAAREGHAPEAVDLTFVCERLLSTGAARSLGSDRGDTRARGRAQERDKLGEGEGVSEPAG